MHRLVTCALVIGLVGACRPDHPFPPERLHHELLRWWAFETGALAALYPPDPVCLPSDVTLCECLPEGPGQRVITLPVAERLDLNRAHQGQLEELPGIGPTIAGRIIERRPYASLEDLLGVSGIGHRTLQQLLPLVRVVP